MKHMKHFLSAVLALAMVLALAVPSFATNLTINNTANDGGSHTYDAYQIFSGTASEGTVLSNVAWGTGVNGDALLAALKANGTDSELTTAFAEAASAADVAGALEDKSADFTAKFAEIVAQHLSDAKTSVPGDTTTELADGYYFVKNSDSTSGTSSAATGYIVQLVGGQDVTMTEKTDVPVVAKKVKENNRSGYQDSWNDAADYSIGDAVPFRLVGLVPDMSNYDTYYYQFSDTMSSALTFNSNSVQVYLETGDSMYAVETQTAEHTSEITTDFAIAAEGNGFTVTCDNLKDVASASEGKYIVVEYTATLNENAVIGNPGNPNKVSLNFSNNPNNDEHGTVGPDEVVVFTFDIPVEKYYKDTNDAETPLAGAKFALFATSDVATAAVTSKNYDAALKFSQVTTDGTAVAGSYIKDADGAYELSASKTGTYSIKGLDQGTYYLVETEAPAGYNLLTAPVEVTVAATYDETTYKDGHTPKTTNDQLSGYTLNDSSKIKVENKKGNVLPSTGGMGTTIFTVVGLVLVAGAGILLVARRKVHGEENK